MSVFNLRTCAPAGALVLLMTFSHLSFGCEWSVKNGWIRFVSASNMGGAYAEFSNDGKSEVVIDTISSPMFAKIESHQTVLKDGLMKMVAYKLAMSPQSKTLFEPKGKHLMLFDPIKPLSVGDHVGFMFKDKMGCIVESSFEVKEII